MILYRVQIIREYGVLGEDMPRSWIGGQQRKKSFCKTFLRRTYKKCNILITKLLNNNSKNNTLLRKISVCFNFSVDK